MDQQPYIFPILRGRRVSSQRILLPTLSKEKVGAELNSLIDKSVLDVSYDYGVIERCSKENGHHSKNWDNPGSFKSILDIQKTSNLKKKIKKARKTKLFVVKKEVLGPNISDLFLERDRERERDNNVSQSKSDLEALINHFNQPVSNPMLKDRRKASHINIQLDYYNPSQVQYLLGQKTPKVSARIRSFSGLGTETSDIPATISQLIPNTTKNRRVRVVSAFEDYSNKYNFHTEVINTYNKENTEEQRDVSVLNSDLKTIDLVSKSSPRVRLTSVKERCDYEEKCSIGIKNSILRSKRHELSEKNKNLMLKFEKPNDVNYTNSQVLTKIKMNIDNVSKPSFLFTLNDNDRKKYISEDNDNSIQRAYYASKIGEHQTYKYKDILAKRYGKDILHDFSMKKMLNEEEESEENKKKQQGVIEKDYNKKAFKNVEGLLSGLIKQKGKVLTSCIDWESKMKQLEKKTNVNKLNFGILKNKHH